MLSIPLYIPQALWYSKCSEIRPAQGGLSPDWPRLTPIELVPTLSPSDVRPVDFSVPLFVQMVLPERENTKEEFGELPGQDPDLPGLRADVHLQRW